MNHTILATDEMKEQIEDLYLKAEDILEIAGTHKLRYSPWFRGIEREVERQMLWEMDNPAGMPSPKIRRDWEQYRELQEEFYNRLSKGLYGSGLQGQRKVAAVLAQIWLTLHRQFGLGGEFLCWLDLRFHVFLPLTAREKEELQAQREAESLDTDDKAELVFMPIAKCDSFSIITKPLPIVDFSQKELRSPVRPEGEEASLAGSEADGYV